MRALLLIGLLLCVLIVSSSAVTMCPFDKDIPSELTLGSFNLGSQVVSNGYGFFNARETSSYYDQVSGNSYSYTGLAYGKTNFAGETLIGNSLSTSKAVEQEGGSLSVEENYYQGAMSLTNLTYCDSTTGGSSAALGNGQVVSQLVLNKPIDASYNVAMGNAEGFGSVFMTARSKEGNNSTVIDEQTYSNAYLWAGKFEMGASNSIRIIHPISSNYKTLSKLVMPCA